MWMGTLCNGQARWVAARTTHTVEEARIRHQAAPAAIAALGRLMTGTLLLGATFKNAGDITARLLSDGPLRGALAVGNRLGQVRAYAQNPQADAPPKRPGKLDVAAVVGQGEFAVSRPMDNGAYYTGTVPIISGEIAEDFAHYLLHSEQIPSAVLLGVLVETDLHVAGSGGLLLQPLPEADESTLQALEACVARLGAGISVLVAEDEDMSAYVDRCMGTLPYRVQEKTSVQFTCSCAKQKLTDVLASLGDEELANLIAQGEAEVVCHFCNERYLFSREELLKIRSAD
jgi:molecular chaperone Hsp33